MKRIEEWLLLLILLIVCAFLVVGGCEVEAGAEELVVTGNFSLLEANNISVVKCKNVYIGECKNVYVCEGDKIYISKEHSKVGDIYDSEDGKYIIIELIPLDE